MSEIDVGQVIAGKYELVRLIGKGAMGEVWAATHNSLGGEFAVKLVRPSDDIEDETAAGRFQLEAQVSAKLSRRTRHIVSVSDHGEEDGLAYLVMELLDGESLEARVKRKGSLTVGETAAMLLQVARALEIAHGEGIFHRDLKPANVFFTVDEDGRMLVKLLDFGIARTIRPMRTRSPFATGKDMVLGTPSYMSPEQARGLETLDYRCDIWALAVVAYEALTHRIPWEGTTVEDIFLSICTYRYVPIRTVRPDLPDAIDAIFARAFAPKVDDRFAQATELASAFEALASPEEIQAAIDERVDRSKPLPPVRSGARSAPSLPQQPVASAPEAAPRTSAGSDPVGTGVALGETAKIRRHGVGGGWIGVAAAAIGTLAIVIVAVLAFGPKVAPASAPSGSTHAAAPDPTPLASTSATAAAKPDAPAADTVSSPTPPAPPASIARVSAEPPMAAAHPRRPAARKPSGATATPAATAPATPATAAPPPATAAPVPTKKPAEKGEIL